MWNPLASLPPSNALAAYAAPQASPLAAMTPLSGGNAVAGLPGRGRGPRMQGAPIPGMVPGVPGSVGLNGGGAVPGVPGFQNQHGMVGHDHTKPIFPGGGPQDAPPDFHAAMKAWRETRPDLDFSAFLGLQAPDGMGVHQALAGWRGGAAMPTNFTPGFAAAAQPFFDWGAARPMRSDF